MHETRLPETERITAGVLFIYSFFVLNLNIFKSQSYKMHRMIGDRIRMKNERSMWICDRERTQVWHIEEKLQNGREN